MGRVRNSLNLYITLIVTAVAMAFSLGYFTLFIQGSNSATQDDVLRINQIKLEFLKEQNPITSINFNSIYYSRSHFQLLDPIYIMPQGGAPTTGRHDQYSSNRDCFENLTELLNRSNFQKVWIWEEFRCGKRFQLPRNFFQQAPFIHPSGKSYALLAFESKRKNFDSREWVIANLPFFHVTEFNRITSQVGSLDGFWGILEKLSYEDLSALATGQDTILTRDYLFSRVQYPDFYFIFEYRVFSRQDLENFLKGTRYYLHEYEIGESCFYRDGQLCWDYNAKHFLSIVNRGSLVFLIGFLIIIILLIRLIIVKLKNQRVEDERRRLALQVLTHEFRTPIASMLLMMERLFKRIDDFDDEMQEAILHLSADVYRLQRLTETSRNYLRVQKGKGLVSFNFEKLDSLNTFIEDQIYVHTEKYGEDKVQFTPLEEDGEFVLDPYWLGICFKNILNNAVDHGDFPIRIYMDYNPDTSLTITVEDRGECNFTDLNEMTEEFIKGTKSEGTGLGLNIVKKVMEDMGGSLSFQPNPTRFSLTVKKPRQKN